MANIRINALTATATTPNFDDYFVIDGSTCGTRNILVTTALSACNVYIPGSGTCSITTNLTSNVNTAGGNYATVAGGANNNAAANFSFIGAGSGNILTGPYSAILGGVSNNDNNCCSVFILGTGISATAVNTTYVNNLSTSGSVCANLVNVNYTSNSANNFGNLYVGTPGAYSFNNSGQIAVFAGCDNVESFVTVTNTNSGTCAYTAFSIGNNNYTNNYAEFSINSTNYSYAAAGYCKNSLNAPSAAALYNYGGDLSIATWTNNNLHFLTNAQSATIDSLIICSNNNIVSASGGLYGNPVYSNGSPVCTSPTGGLATPTVSGAVYGCTTISPTLNTFLGLSAGNATTTGCCNVFIGVNAGNGITTGYCNTFIGAGVGSNISNSGICCTTLIGAGATCLCIQNGTVSVSQLLTGSPLSLNICGYYPTYNCLPGALPLISFACYTTAGSFIYTAPNTTITSASAILVGGGGGGGGFYNQTAAGGGGGGVLITPFSVIPNNTYSVNVGAGGSGSGYSGNNGCVTTLSSTGYFLLTASGGGGGSVGAGDAPGGANVAPLANQGGFVGLSFGPSPGCCCCNGGSGGGAGGIKPGNPNYAGLLNPFQSTQIGYFSADGRYYVSFGGLQYTGQYQGIGSGSGGGGGPSYSSNPGCNGGNGSVIIATTGPVQVPIGATYVTQDTCTLYYWNGNSYTSRGIYNSAYNQTSNNLCIGTGSLTAVSGVTCSVGIGGYSYSNLTSGVGNVGVGYNAGYGVSSANYTIAIGYSATPSNITGHTVWGNANNNVCNCVYAAWSTVSDCRDKTNITTLPSTLGLTFIRQLSPVVYQSDHRDLYVSKYGCTYGAKDGTLTNCKQHYGLIAQDVNSTVLELSTKFDALGYDKEKDAYRLTYEELIAPIIASIKELDTRISKLED